MRDCKPFELAHVQIGGWAEIYVGEVAPDGANFDSERSVFGYVEDIANTTIYFRIADQVFSPAKTGFARGELVELELADLTASEFSPGADATPHLSGRRERIQ
ncbi:MAG TPA: hypothetical protein VFA65_22135 [Bryobacteraceae bacterium]|nr:hypothetical protein [Bryobacteraceae bacterium]